MDLRCPTAAYMAVVKVRRCLVSSLIAGTFRETKREREKEREREIDR